VSLCLLIRCLVVVAIFTLPPVAGCRNWYKQELLLTLRKTPQSAVDAGLLLAPAGGLGPTSRTIHGGFQCA
jgi:hypothetical protein